MSTPVPMPWSNLKQSLKNSIIVSVQASKGEPLNRSDILEALGLSVLSGGAKALRMANTIEDDPIGYFKERHPEIPVIGLTKPVKIPTDAHQHIYITPDTPAIDQLIAAKADIIALDATLRPRSEGQALEDLVEYCHAKAPYIPLMADVATLEEGLHAASLGFEMISTTLSGYTTDTLAKSQGNAGPDFELLTTLVKVLGNNTPIFLEGRVWHPAEVKKAFELGAHAVVIGSAITRPHHITQRFCKM